MDWRAQIMETMQANAGLATRKQLIERIPGVVLDGHIGRGNLIRVFPHVYRMRESPADDATALRAALLHVGPLGALSHTTALAVWGLRPLERPFHATVDQSVKRAGSAALTVHRRLRFDPRSAQCIERRGLLVTVLPRTLIDSWPLLPPTERRPLVLDVARQGLTTGGLLADALDERPNVAGHRALRQTIELVDDGCQSELEALGVLNVFRHASLPRSVGQYRVALANGTVKLDRAWPEVKLAVELDGARHHTSPDDRQRDLARDAALAAIGWVVLRFTFADVRHNPDAVRARVGEVYRMRAAQLRAG